MLRKTREREKEEGEKKNPSRKQFGSEMERVRDGDRVRNHTDLIFFFFFLIPPCQKKTDRFIKAQHKCESFLKRTAFGFRMHYG